MLALLTAALTAPTPALAQTVITLPEAHRPQVSNRQLHRCPPGVSFICGVEIVGRSGIGVIGGAVGAGASTAANAVMDGVVGWAASGAAWLVKAVAGQVDQSTRPALASPWFGERYRTMRNIAIPLTLLFLLVAIIQAVSRRDLGMLARACLVALPLSLLLMFAAVTLVALGLAVTDELTAAAVNGSGANVKEAFSDLADVLAPATVTGTPLPGFVLFLGAVLTAFLALVVWIELILREAAIYVAVAFLPIALAAVVWPRTAIWARRLAEWLSAVVLAKFTIAASFAIAGSMLAHGRSGSGGLTALLAGCAVLLIAALSPWALLRLIPFVEQAATGLHRGSVGGAVKTAPGAHVTTLLVHQAMLKNFTAARPAAAAMPRPAVWAPAPLSAREPEGRR
jgi:hypothetical protein